MPDSSDHISPAQFDMIEKVRSQLMAVTVYLLGAEPATIEAIASRINDRVTAADQLVRGNRGRDVAITMTDMRLMFVGTLRILLDELGGSDASSAALLTAARRMLAVHIVGITQDQDTAYQQARDALLLAVAKAEGTDHA